SARQFEWRMRYPTGPELDRLIGLWKGDKRGAVLQWTKEPHADDIHVVNELHTWTDAKVRLYLSTRDVLHSFYLPNLRLKQDALPGKIIPVWFRATDYNTTYDKESKVWLDGFDPQNGKTDQPHQVWDLACAELC